MKKVLLLLVFVIGMHAEDLSLCSKGWNYTLSKKFDSAIILFNKCIEQGNLSKESLAQTYRNIGITYNQSGQYKKAIESYSKALEYKNNFIDFVNRGNAWSNLDEYKNALEDYKRALELNPSNPEIYHNRGLVYFRLGLLEKTAIEYKQAYSLGLRTKNFFNDIKNLKNVESYHASVSFVMTISNLIGRTAKNCIPYLNKDDKWMNDLVLRWTNTNKKYVDASKLYLENYFNELSNKNKEASEALQRYILEMVTKNSKLSTQEILSKYSSKIKSCENFEDSVMKGNYDITTKTKMYNELQNLVNIVNK